MLKNILKIITAPLVVFLFHANLILIFKIYNIYPWFDIPMHFLGGFAIGISALLILKIYAPKNKFQLPFWMTTVFILGLVTIAAVWWEFVEYLGDYFFQTHMQESLRDTMGDLLMGTLGGLTIIFWNRLKK